MPVALPAGRVWELEPSPWLRGYVRCYHYTELRLGAVRVSKPLTARPEQMMQFSLARPFSVVDHAAGTTSEAPSVVLVGRQTRRNLDLISTGDLRTFTVHVAVPEHIHRKHDESYYVLDGTFRFKLGDELADAPAGTFVFIPRGTPHAWSNGGGQVGRLTIIFTPGGMAGYFEELAPYLPELMAGLPDLRTVDPATLQRATAIMQQYHYELVGPPLSS